MMNVMRLKNLLIFVLVILLFGIGFCGLQRFNTD